MQVFYFPDVALGCRLGYKMSIMCLAKLRCLALYQAGGVSKSERWPLFLACSN